MKRLFPLFVIGVLMGHMAGHAAVSHLLPRPQRITVQDTDPLKTRRVRIAAPADSARVAGWCERQGLLVSTDRAVPLFEVCRCDSVGGASNQDEAYTLRVETDRIRVEAVTETGVIRALQTLSQLAEGRPGRKGIRLETVEIVDWPAFRVRGFMHDVGRGYIPVEQLKRDIDLLSRYKVNVFHFHLTENLAWRLQSKRFPELNADANFGRLPGRYYTFEETRELERFCRERGVLLLPEIDMPGHSAAFTKTFGYDMQTPEGMEKLRALLEEVCKEAFPESPYLHIGTDEVVIRNPQFVPQMVAHVRGLGKRVMSWNPGADYRVGEIDALQLWSSRGRFHPGIPCIDCRYHYINHFDTYADVAGVYGSMVCEQPMGDYEHAGVILAAWNDRNLPRPEDIISQNGLYAAMLAVAERAWMGGGSDYITRSGVNLPRKGTPEFEAFADWERRFLYHKDHTLRSVPIPYVKQTHMRWRITEPFDNGGDVEAIFPPENGVVDTVIFYECELHRTHEVYGAGVYLRHVWGTVLPALYARPEPNHTAYAYTYVYSPREQWVGAQIAFHDYGRSENDLPPRPGTWDYKGSRVWVNGNELLPPEWVNTHQKKDSEIPLQNENFSARAPYPVHLVKGWNRVLLKLPVAAFSSEAVRLEKWMFTFALTTPDGRHAAPDLVYSPTCELDE